jgi:hypothetical protein
MLDSAPATVTLTFTEPPDPRLSIVHVLDVNGTPVESGPAEAVPGPDDQLRIGLPADLPDGVYTVSWRVVSETDGHSSAGAFGFGVGVPPGSAIEPSVPAPATPPPSLATVAGRAALYAGVALLFASAVVGLWAFGGTVPARRSVLWISAALAVLGVGLYVARWWLLLAAVTPVVVLGALELAGHRSPWHDSGPPLTQYGWFPVVWWFFWFFLLPLFFGVSLRRGLGQRGIGKLQGG